MFLISPRGIILRRFVRKMNETEISTRSIIRQEKRDPCYILVPHKNRFNFYVHKFKINLYTEPLTSQPALYIQKEEKLFYRINSLFMLFFRIVLLFTHRYLEAKVYHDNKSRIALPPNAESTNTRGFTTL